MRRNKSARGFPRADKLFTWFVFLSDSRFKKRENGGQHRNKYNEHQNRREVVLYNLDISEEEAQSRYTSDP